MSSILDTLKQAFTDVSDVQNTTAKAVVGAVGGTSIGKAADSIASKISSGEYEQKVDRALDLAEILVAVSITASVIAALSSAGMFVIQAKQFQRQTGRSVWSSNPKRKRRRR